LPSLEPTAEPSGVPSEVPSDLPSLEPTAEPSGVPSEVPSEMPSLEPTAEPSGVPSEVPSETPSFKPSEVPSSSPSIGPSEVPSSSPSNKPSAEPSLAPSEALSSSPTLTETETIATGFIVPDGGSVTVSQAEESTSNAIKKTISNARRRQLSPYIDTINDIRLATRCVTFGQEFDCLTDLTVQCIGDQCLTKLDNAVTTVTEEPIEDFKATLQDEITTTTADSDILIDSVDVKIASNTPSEAPSEVGGICGNDPTFKTAKKGRDCNWVAGRPDSRCKMEGEDGSSANESCPLSCNLRCSCKNSKKKFSIKKTKQSKKDSKKKGKGKTNCAKIKPENGDCSKPAGVNKIVADFCPKKCNDCYNL
jgi:hypothetical protein